MFCKHCGNEIADDSVFCAKCGKKVKEENANPDSMGENIANENETVDKQECAPKEECPNSDSMAKSTAASENAANEQNSVTKEDDTNSGSDSCARDAANENDAVKKTGDASIDEVVTETIENTNPLCIAGLVLTFVMFFFNYYCIVGFAAFILSFFGYKAAKKNGQKGTTLAIVCMVVSGIASLVYLVCLIEYMQYESAVYGGVNGLLDLLNEL